LKVIFLTPLPEPKVTFLQKAFPSPNSSRTMLMMSSAWESVLAKMRVLGISKAPWASKRSGKISGSFSRNVRMMVRICEGLTTSRSSCLAEYSSSSSCCCQRRARVSFSRFSTRPLRILPPFLVTSVSMT
jgi:hypothetical protein